jgi:hypothetical protein
VYLSRCGAIWSRAQFPFAVNRTVKRCPATSYSALRGFFFGNFESRLFCFRLSHSHLSDPSTGRHEGGDDELRRHVSPAM